MKRSLIFAATVLAIGISLEAGRAESPAVPGMITYQGVLLDSQGEPHTGTTDLTIRIYDALTSGVLLYVQEFTGTPLSDGVFTVVLGPTGSATDLPDDPLTTGLADALAGDPGPTAPSRFLEVTVGATGALSRTQILTVPYALDASRLQGTDAADIQMRVTQSCPAGEAIQLIEADGSVTCEASLQGPMMTEADFLAVFADSTGNVLKQADSNIEFGANSINMDGDAKNGLRWSIESPSHSTAGLISFGQGKVGQSFYWPDYQTSTRYNMDITSGSRIDQDEHAMDATWEWSYKPEGTCVSPGPRNGDSCGQFQYPASCSPGLDCNVIAVATCFADGGQCEAPESERLEWNWNPKAVEYSFNPGAVSGGPFEPGETITASGGAQAYIVGSCTTGSNRDRGWFRCTDDSHCDEDVGPGNGACEASIGGVLTIAERTSGIDPATGGLARIQDAVGNSITGEDSGAQATLGGLTPLSRPWRTWDYVWETEGNVADWGFSASPWQRDMIHANTRGVGINLAGSQIGGSLHVQQGNIAFDGPTTTPRATQMYHQWMDDSESPSQAYGLWLDFTAKPGGSDQDLAGVNGMSVVAHYSGERGPSNLSLTALRGLQVRLDTGINPLGSFSTAAMAEFQSPLGSNKPTSYYTLRIYDQLALGTSRTHIARIAPQSQGSKSGQMGLWVWEGGDWNTGHVMFGNNSSSLGDHFYRNQSTELFWETEDGTPNASNSNARAFATTASSPTASQGIGYWGIGTSGDSVCGNLTCAETRLASDMTTSESCGTTHATFFFAACHAP